jgi:hypothetical protein
MNDSESVEKETMQERQSTELASDFFRQLSHYMDEFDKSLDQEHEVGIKLVNFGQTVQFTVQNIGYYNPKLICFYGEMPDGSAIQLIQHVNQISFLLTAVQRKNPEQPKRPIGFCPDLYRYKEGYPAYLPFKKINDKR